MAVGVVVVSSNKNDRLDEGEELLVDLCDTEEQLGKMTVRELREKINNKLLQEFPPKPAAGDLQTSEMIYQVVVTVIDGQKITIDLCKTEEEMQRITVGELKDKIFERFLGITECTKEDLKLIFGNKRLEDDTKRLVDYGIMHKSSIYVIASLEGGGGPEPDPRGDGMGDKEGETRRSKEQLTLNL